MAIEIAELESPKAPATRDHRGALTPMEKRKEAPRKGGWKEIRLFGSGRVGLDETVLFTQQLVLLIETGNGLVPSIDALSSQAGSPAMRKVLASIHRNLEEGNDLSVSLRKHPKVFGNLYVSLVKAGEASGAFHESLIRLGGILDVRRRLRSRMKDAMTYPAVLTCVMGATVIFLMTYVVPKFADIFDSMGDELPISTRMLLGTADFLRTRWYVVVLGLVVAGFAFRMLWKTPPVRLLWDRIKIGTPVVGAITSEAYLFQLFSSFGLLLRSRVPHMEAIGIAKEVVRNAYYESFFDKLARNVEAGRGFAVAFREASFLPSTVKLMISTGETSGALDVVMARLADHYRESLEGGIKKLSLVFEQVMLILMGVVVGFVAISFILPIMKMSKAVH
ncbi:MAG: type II secretion system F family protein [Candidatus Eisenbacteria bacterium]